MDISVQTQECCLGLLVEVIVDHCDVAKTWSELFFYGADGKVSSCCLPAEHL